MQKIVDLYRGEQGTCTVLLARTATLTHSSPGIWILKCQNEGLLEGHAWIACLSLPCLSVERKSSNPSTGAKELCRAYPSRAPACLREQRLLPEAGQPLLGWPQEAVREPRRAPAPARCRSEMLSKYKTRHCFHSGTATHPQDCSRECLCASSSFQMHSQRVVASLLSALSTWAAQARNC